LSKATGGSYVYKKEDYAGHCGHCHNGDGVDNRGVVHGVGS